MRLVRVTLTSLLLALTGPYHPAFADANPATLFPGEVVVDNFGTMPRGTLKASAVYGQLPLSFEANHGQTDRQVNFLVRGRGYALHLTPTEAVMTLHGPRPSDSAVGRRAASGSKRTAFDRPRVLRVQLVGANPVSRVSGLDQLPGKVNYLIGNDASKWRTNVPTYAKVKYENVYPGIDLVYYGKQGELEYDLIVAPGTDPNIITLAFEGADRLEIDLDGDLIVHVAGAHIRQNRPFVYQDIGGVRKAVAGRYVLASDHRVGFRMAAYDVTRALVLDPVLIYSTYLGGSDFDFARAIAVDSTGSAYVAGGAGSSDFPTQNPLPYPHNPTDAFVAKLNPEGSALVYSTYLGGIESDFANGIAVDATGSAYVTGSTMSRDFPTKNAVQPKFGGVRIRHDGSPLGDAFVAKLDPHGSSLVYSTYLGGGGNETGAGIAVDRVGNAYITGQTDSPQFPTRNALYPHFSGRDFDAFVAKLNPQGSAWIYSTFLGGGGGQLGTIGSGIAADSDGNAHVTGLTDAQRFPVKNAFQAAPGPPAGQCCPLAGDAFVTKLNAQGSALVYSTYLGGYAGEEGRSIAVDASGNAYVTGSTSSEDFPRKNPIQQPEPLITGNRGDSAFVTKLSSAGALVYSTYLGSSPICAAQCAQDSGEAITVDAAGNAYAMGRTSSPGFPVTAGASQTRFGGFFDAFVVKLDGTGTVLLYSGYLGGSDLEVPGGIAVDTSGNIYVTGITGSSDFPILNAFQPAKRSSQSAFITKLNPQVPLDVIEFPVTLPSLSPHAFVKVPYVGNIGVGGGRPPYTITVVNGALPAGLNFEPISVLNADRERAPGAVTHAVAGSEDVSASPLITGIPQQPGTACFDVQVTDPDDPFGIVSTYHITTLTAPTAPPPPTRTLAVVREAATGSDLVTSAPVGITCGATCTVTYDVCKEVTLTATASPGSVFAGWGGACSGTGSCVMTMNEDTTVIARFAATPRRTLTVTPLGTGSGRMTSMPAGIDCGTACAALFDAGTGVTLTAHAASGSVFAGWGGACSGTGSCTVILNEDTTVTTRFDGVRPRLTVTAAGEGSGYVDSAPAGIGCGGACVASYEPGTVVTLTATVYPGSAFKGWGGACSGTGLCIVTLTADTTVIAQFAATPRRTLTVTPLGTGSGRMTSMPAGIDCGTACAALFDAGTGVTLTARAASGSVFAGWGGACSGTGSCTVILNEDTTVTTRFDGVRPRLTVTAAGEGSGFVESAPAGIGCDAACVASYEPGTVVTLTATVYSGSAFKGWGGACSGTGLCIVTLTADTTVTAQFDLAPTPWLTVTLAGSGSGRVTSAIGGIDCASTCRAPYDAGAVVMLTAAPAAGSLFAGWSGGGCSGMDGCTVRLSEDTVVTATFLPPPSLGLRLNKSTFGSGETLRLDLTVANVGPATVVDVYFGVLLPSTAEATFGCPGRDAVAFVKPGFADVHVTCLSAPQQSYPVFASSVSVPGTLPLTTVPDFFSLMWPSNAPRGSYVFFMALVRPGAVAGGQLAAGDLIAAAATAAAFSP